MHRAQEQVRDFMRAMAHPTPCQITKLTPERLRLRLDLIDEEFQELVIASGGAFYHSDMNAGFTLEDTDRDPKLVDQIDAMCDLLYVVYGMAIEMGIDLQPFFEIVHEANMKKGPGPVREDGKKLKPSGWVGPEGEIRRYLDLLRRVALVDDPDVV